MFRIECQDLLHLLALLWGVLDCLHVRSSLRSQVEKRTAVDNRVLGPLLVIVDPHTVVSCPDKQITRGFKGLLTFTTWPSHHLP